jgi:hypothetical protein
MKASPVEPYGSLAKPHRRAIATVQNLAPRRLALLWQDYRPIGLPNQVFNDSWVVGFWRAGHGRQTVELEGRACALA